MDIRHLRYFLAVARELNFTRAAASLYMSVPPLSQRIRELEAEVGCRLFERTTRHTRLTAEGERLLPLATRIVTDMERIPSVVHETEPRLHVTVGIPDLLGTPQRQCLGVLFEEEKQDVDVQIRHVASLEIDQALLSRAIDLGVSRVRSSHPDLVEVDVLTEPVSVICDASHFPAGAVLHPADLANFTLVGGPPYWDLRSDAERVPLRNAGIRFDPSLTYSDLGGMLILLRRQQRFSLVPSHADMIRGLDPEEFSAHRLGDEVPPLMLSLVRRRSDEWLHDFSTACLDALSNSVPAQTTPTSPAPEQGNP
ncbi:MAG: LysR family transcriptional regulator [Corynebacterium sp.]|uniref:LysR family transcriptional regulator n=1 Tax=Corynebacterium sp. TaxID=1720 RepID=UPI003F045E20